MAQKDARVALSASSGFVAGMPQRPNAPLRRPHSRDEDARIAREIAAVELSGTAARYVRLAGAAAAICGGLYGYDTGIISGALLLITKEFHLGHTAQELVASAILLGAVVGAIGSGLFTQRLGRRRTVMIVTALFTVGAIACALAPGVELLIAARVFLGLAVGGATQVVPMYISELAPAARRGNMVTMFNVAIGIGILVANTVGVTLVGVWSWRAMVAIAAIPASFVFVSMFFLPESPRWIAENRSVGAAIGVLARLRTSRDEIRDEIAQIRDVARDTAPGDRGWRGIRQPWVRPALVAALGVAFFTQCGGLEMMIYYTPTFLKNVGLGSSAALLASLGVAIVYAIMTTLGCLYVDRIGRRRLILVMAPGSALSLVGLGIMFALGTKGGVGGWLVIAFLLAFMMFNSGGIQVVGWLLGGGDVPAEHARAGAPACTRRCCGAATCW